MGYAAKVPGADTQGQGAGEINYATMVQKNPVTYTQKFTNSTGTGRSSSHAGRTT
jgi:hypothetical protein